MFIYRLHSILGAQNISAHLDPIPIPNRIMCNAKCLTVHQGGHQQISRLEGSNKNLLSCRKCRDTKANRAANQAQPSNHQPSKARPNPSAQVKDCGSGKACRGMKSSARRCPTACQDIIMLKYCSAVLNQHKGKRRRPATPRCRFNCPTDTSMSA